MIFKAIGLDEITKGGSLGMEKGQDMSLEVLQHLTVRHSNEDQEEPTHTYKGKEINYSEPEVGILKLLSKSGLFFLHVSQAKSGFYIFKWLKKSLKEEYYCVTHETCI